MKTEKELNMLDEYNSVILNGLYSRSHNGILYLNNIDNSSSTKVILELANVVNLLGIKVYIHMNIFTYLYQKFIKKSKLHYYFKNDGIDTQEYIKIVKETINENVFEDIYNEYYKGR